MKKKMNLTAIIVVVMVAMLSINLVSCTADEEYGDLAFGTLAEGLFTRSGGDPGDSSQPPLPRMTCGRWVLLHYGVPGPDIDSLINSIPDSKNANGDYKNTAVYEIAKEKLGFSHHYQDSDVVRVLDELQYSKVRMFAYQGDHIVCVDQITTHDIAYQDQYSNGRWEISDIMGIMY